MISGRLPVHIESPKGETLILARDERDEIVNVHTTAQDLDPWYQVDDPDDEITSPRYRAWISGHYDVFDWDKEREDYS